MEIRERFYNEADGEVFYSALMSEGEVRLFAELPTDLYDMYKELFGSSSKNSDASISKKIQQRDPTP